MNSSMEQISNPTKKSCHHNTSLSLSLLPPSWFCLKVWALSCCSSPMTAWLLPRSMPWWSCTLTLWNHKPQINPLFCTWPWPSCFCHSNRNLTETQVLEWSLSLPVIETASVQALRYQNLSPHRLLLEKAAVNLPFSLPECHPPNTRSMPTKRSCLTHTLTQVCWPSQPQPCLFHDPKSPPKNTSMHPQKNTPDFSLRKVTHTMIPALRMQKQKAYWPWMKTTKSESQTKPWCCLSWLGWVVWRTRKLTNTHRESRSQGMNSAGEMLWDIIFGGSTLLSPRFPRF